MRAENFVEALQLRYNLAIVVRALALELGHAPQLSAFPAQSRRAYFDTLAMWCKDGTEESSGALGFQSRQHRCSLQL